MRYKQLGSTGLNVSVVGFGGIPIQRVDPDQAVEILAACREQGINFIDTARMYTDSEEKIGRFLRGEKREDWYIASKSVARDYQGMEKEIQTSLRQLGCDYIDLYQLHNVGTEADMKKIMAEDGALAAAEKARRQGYVRHIGITGHKPEILEPAVSSGRFATIQLPFSPLEQQAKSLLKEAVHVQKMGAIAMKPLAGGALGPAVAALAYILEQDFIDVVIPGMDCPDQVAANCVAVTGEVSQEDKDKLQQVVDQLGNRFCRRCEYCKPCPHGLNIPVLFLMEGYYSRYNLKDWAWERYHAMDKQAADCVECGICETRCPYDLPIREMLAEVDAVLGGESPEETG